MFLKMLYRDEGEAGGGDPIETPVEETPEVTEEPVEEGGKEEITPEAESTEEPWDEKKYLRQYENIPEDVESVDDAIKKLDDVLGGMPGFKKAQTEAAKKAEIDARLKQLGYVNGIDDIDKIIGQARQPAPQPSPQQGWATATQILQEKVNNNELMVEEAQHLYPIAQHLDQVTQSFGYGFMQLQEQIKQLQAHNEKFLSSHRDTAYRDYVSQVKQSGGRPITKDNLDRVTERFPEMNYFEAHAFSLAKDPKQAERFYKGLTENAGRVEKKKFNPSMRGKGSPGTKSLGEYKDYLGPDGRPDARWKKLSSKEQDELLDREIGAHQE